VAQISTLNTAAAVQVVLRAKPVISATATSVSLAATRTQMKVIAGCWRLIQKPNHERSQPGWPSLIPMTVDM
jgi:hypothetical protein